MSSSIYELGVFLPSQQFHFIPFDFNNLNLSHLKFGSNLNLMIFLSQNVGEDVMMGSLMSSIGASFVHLRIGSLPAFLPIPLHSLQLGLLKRDQEWLRELSWDQSWKNFVGQTTKSNLISSNLISQHYTEPEDMYQLHSSSQRVIHKICCCAAGPKFDCLYKIHNFLLYCNKTWPIIHEQVILTQFNDNRTKNVDFF